MQKIDRALCMRRGAEDQPLVVAQRLQPRGDIGSVILAHLRGDAEIGSEKSRSELGNQFLGRIPFVAKPLPPEIPRQPARVLGPVSLMPISA